MLSWMLFIIIAFGFGQRRPLYWIPASLCAICIFASFGPQGMSSFSRYSQWMRLQHTWDESQVNKDPALNESVSNTYRYLRRFHPSEALESWLASHPILDNYEHYRNISLKHFPIRVHEHLSLVEFEIIRSGVCRPPLEGPEIQDRDPMATFGLQSEIANFE